jgi:hypothetical protein
MAVDIDELRRMWIAGVPANEIARHLGIRRPAMHELRRLHGIADRVTKYTKRIVDPTPDEIAERARECRERHYADRRAEKDETSRKKAWRHSRDALA